MGNMIVSDNQIKTRRYNLLIDGEIVEEMLSPRMANILANEYREEGYRVDKIEVFSVTKGIEIVGDDMVENKPDVIIRKQLGTPAATEKKVQLDRDKSHAKNVVKAAKKKNDDGGTRYVGYGRDRKSPLHKNYLAALRKDGYRVFNKLNGDVKIGFQKEIVDYIFSYCKNGGRKSDLDIKFLGA